MSIRNNSGTFEANGRSAAPVMPSAVLAVNAMRQKLAEDDAIE